jgi:hypothetical protein
MADDIPAPGKNGGTPAKTADKGGRQQRTISNPEDVAKLVMMQIDAINTRKDDLTVALKQLTDTMRQLVRAYAQQAGVIQGMAKKLKELEEKAGAKK